MRVQAASSLACETILFRTPATVAVQRTPALSRYCICGVVSVEVRLTYNLFFSRLSSTPSLLSSLLRRSSLDHDPRDQSKSKCQVTHHEPGRCFAPSPWTSPPRTTVHPLNLLSVSDPGPHLWPLTPPSLGAYYVHTLAILSPPPLARYLHLLYPFRPPLRPIPAMSLRSRDRLLGFY